MLLGRTQHLCEGSNGRLLASTDNGEVEVGGVAVLVANMDEPQGRSTLEGQPTTIVCGAPMELSNDVGEDVVPLHDERVNLLGICFACDGVAREHGSVVRDGSQLIRGQRPRNTVAIINPLHAV